MMIIAHRTAPGVYVVLTPGAPVLRQVDTTVVVLDSTIADPELVETSRDVVVWDATLVDGQVVRAERTVQATDRRPRDGRVVMLERPVAATDVITYPWSTIIAMDVDELAALDLVQVVETAVPAGKVSTSWTVEDVEGVPTQVHQLEDEPPPPVPATISFRQLVLQLLAEGEAADAQALAARTVPPGLQTIFDGLPTEQQTVVTLTLATMIEADRVSPLIDLFAAGYGWGSAEVDDFFRAAGAL